MTMQESQRIENLRNLYGMTLEEYEDRRAAQGGVCAICRKPQLDGHSLFVDHDHSNGKVRGLLCHHCNVVLGHLERLDAAIMSRMVAYRDSQR